MPASRSRARWSCRCSGFLLQAEDGIRYADVTGVQTCALPISPGNRVLPRKDNHGELSNESLLVRPRGTESPTTMTIAPAWSSGVAGTVLARDWRILDAGAILCRDADNRATSGSGSCPAGICAALGLSQLRPGPDSRQLASRAGFRASRVPRLPGIRTPVRL